MKLGNCLIAAALLGMVSPAFAGRDHILIGLDETTVFGMTDAFHAPGRDAVVVLDASNPAHPRIAAVLPMINSVVGPPVNLQITPDGALGLVASSLTVSEKDGKWVSAPDNRLHVIDLTGTEPRMLDDVIVGKQPSGLVISRDGHLALVANRASKSVSVLRIAGTRVTQIAEVPMGEDVLSVAIAAGGKRAFVTKPVAHKVGVLAIDGEKVTYDAEDDIPTGFADINIMATPDGRLVIVVNNGAHGHAANLTVIDAMAEHPHVIDTVSVGDGPEGIAMAPDGKSATLLLLHGSTSAPDHWSYHRNGYAMALKITGMKVTLVPGEIGLGSVPEGAAYSRDGQYVYAADFTDSMLHVLRSSNGKLTDTGTKIPLPGHPASMRGLAQ